jgi:predicted nucleotidyltransferase component of viral defense system
VDHYAAASGVDRSVAERDIVLTYILKLMVEDGIIDTLAFKGGTCLRKIYLGGIGRFSEDLDFTCLGCDFYAFKYDFLDFMEGADKYGFTIKSRDIRGGWGRTFACDLEYEHEWNRGSLKFETSLREDPVLKPEKRRIRDEIYFNYTEFQPFPIPSMTLEEVLSEKIRATYQRGSARDYYDLYQLSERPYDRELVKKLVAIKFWNDESEYDPQAFFDEVREAEMDFSQVQYLLKNQEHPREDAIKERILGTYRYLTQLDEELERIITDTRKHRETQLIKKVKNQLETQ